MSRTSWNAEEPWGRQPWDDDLGWAAFSDYLAQSRPRRLQSLRVGLSVHQLEDIAKRCRWAARASMWDDHISDARRDAMKRVAVETVEEMTRRHISALRKLQSLAERELDKYLRGDFELSPRDIVRFLQLGIKTEREIVDSGQGLTPNQDQDADLATRMANLSTDELRSLREIQKRLGCS